MALPLLGVGRGNLVGPAKGRGCKPIRGVGQVGAGLGAGKGSLGGVLAGLLALVPTGEAD